MNLEPEEKKEIDSAEGYLNGAKAYRIDSEDEFLRANRMLAEIKEKKKEFDNMRKRLKAPINLAAKNIEDFFRKPISTLTDAEQIYKRKILHFHDMQRRKLDKEAQETILKIEDLHQNAIEALKENRADDYLEIDKKIYELSKVGNKEPIKPKNVSYRDNWKAKVTDFKLVLKGVMDGDIPIDILMVNESRLNQYAKNIKDLRTIPGIEFYNDKIIAVRSEPQ